MKYKNIIITGANGTLAPHLINYAKKCDIKVTIWDRTQVSIENQKVIDEFIDSVKPDAFYHLATGDPSWITRIIKSISRYNIPLIFTSTESVFSDSQHGPFTEDHTPLSESDYGKYKRECEALVKDYYNSYIVRLGWQIGLEAKKNNMLAYLKNNTPIAASSQWIPSTSFMPDTALTLIKHLPQLNYGIYHLDGNHDDLSFYEIAKALNKAFSLNIQVVKDDSFVRNNRLMSNNLKVENIKHRLYKNLRT